MSLIAVLAATLSVYGQGASGQPAKAPPILGQPSVIPGAKLPVQKPRPPQKPLSRVDRIWESVDDRVSRQIDLWFKDGDFPKSIQLLYFENSFRPKDENVMTNLGYLLESTEAEQDALDVYAVYAKENPDNPDANFPAANLYYRKKEYQKAIDLLEPTLSGDCHPNTYRILARCYEKLNKFKEAIQTWEKQLVKFPNDGPAKANIARVKAKMGSPSK